MDQVEHALLHEELGVERRVERDRDPVRVRDRPALLADPLDEHLVTGQVATGDAKAAVHLLEVTRLERRAHRAELPSELGPEQGKVRLHAQLGRLDVTELDLLHAQLLADLVRVRLGERGALYHEPAQGLSQRKLRARARLPAQVDDAARLPHLREQLLVTLTGLWP